VTSRKEEHGQCPKLLFEDERSAPHMNRVCRVLKHLFLCRVMEKRKKDGELIRGLYMCSRTPTRRLYGSSRDASRCNAKMPRNRHRRAPLEF
jgi:hypothetical protein